MSANKDNQTGTRIVTDGGARTIPEDDDGGKSVIDMQGREFGLVEDVEGDTMYVDPDASLTESVKSKLSMSGHDADALPVSPAFVDRIDDDVVLDVERDEELQEEPSG